MRAQPEKTPEFAWSDIDELYETDGRPEVLVDALVESQVKTYGDDLSKPCAEVSERLEQWQADNDEDVKAGDEEVDWMAQWRGAVARRQPGIRTIGGGPDLEGEYRVTDEVNAAQIIGEVDPDFDEFLKQAVVFMTGSLYDQGNYKNTKDGDWKRNEWDWNTLLFHDKHGLTTHPENKKKQGESIVIADALDGARNDSAITTMYAAVYDVDSGGEFEQVMRTLRDMNLLAVVHTSFNNGVTELVLKHDDIVRKLKIDDTPNRVQVQEYLREHHKAKFDRDFISKIEIKEARRQTAKGMETVLTIPALEKFRIILPLAEPVVLSDLAPTLQQWKTIWADKITGFGTKTLDIDFDIASCDVNRLFYTPRHPAEGEWRSVLIPGKPLKYEDMPSFSKEKYLRQRKAGDDPFLADTGEGPAQVDVYNAPSGMNLNDWHRKAKERFLISDVLETYCEDRLRTASGERSDTRHVECPFEHEHSAAGGTATMAMNPDANSEGVWTIFCHHDSCKGRHKLEYLSKMLEEEWFPESVLTDEGFLIPLPDQDRDDFFKAAREGPITEFSTEEIKKALADASINQDAAEADIAVFVRRCFDGGADKAARGRVNSALAAATPLTKPAIAKMWKPLDIQADATARQREEQSDTVTPIVNHWDEPDMAEYGESRLLATDDDGNPLLYQFEGDPCLVSDGSRNMISEQQFGAFLSEHSDWLKETQLGDATVRKRVFAPQQVSNFMFRRSKKPYPDLLGVKRAPFFAANGRRVDREGYDAETGLYLDLGGLDVPPVSESPSDAEVSDAVCLLVEEVLSDFPFDGVTDREERLSRILDFDNTDAALPSAAHALCLTLERFARDLIDGPTPCYAVTKPDPSTGAGKLVAACTTIATGDHAAAQVMPTSDEEFDKRSLAIVNQAPEFTFFDNMHASLVLPRFCTALTEGKLASRLLNSSRMIEAPVRTTWVAAANNLKGSWEVIRRMLMIELDAKMEDPGARNGWRHDHLEDWIRANRSQLVWACLTLIQNWVAKGMNPWRGKFKNSFEKWSGVMGGILRDAHVRGFLENERYFKSYATTGADNDLQVFIQFLASKYDSGIALRSRSIGKIRGFDGKVVSIMDELNVADGGDPLAIDGYGYKSETNEYTHARHIGPKFREAARRTYKVTVFEVPEDGKEEDGEVVEYEVSFREFPDPKSKDTFYWIMDKTNVDECPR